MAIDPPLGGSGGGAASRSADTVLLATVSESSDSILWIATEGNGELRGAYKITGGQFRGQGGTWRVSIEKSLRYLPIPRREGLGAPSGFAPSAFFAPFWEPVQVEAADARPTSSYLEFLSILVLLGFAFRLLSVIFAAIAALLVALTKGDDAAAARSVQWGQTTQSGLYGALMALVTVLYIQTHTVTYSFVYFLTGLVWVYTAMGSNAYEKQRVRTGFGGLIQTEQEEFAAKGAALGVIVSLVAYPLIYFWPRLGFVLPGITFFITSAIAIAAWLQSFWLVRVALALIVFGAVIKIGFMALIGGAVVLQQLFGSRTAKPREPAA